MQIILGSVVKGLGGATQSFSKQQLPYFINLGLPQRKFQKGTININIAPKKFEIILFDYFFKNVEWEKGRVEDFGFIEIDGIKYQGKRYDRPGYIYVPHKSPHFNNHSQLEIASIPIHNIKNGSIVEILVGSNKIKISF